MRIVFLVLLSALLSYLGYEIARVSSLILAGKSMVREARPFVRKEGSLRMLVLGDSTAASVGSPPELSVPGRLANLVGASVENYAVSGAHTRHLYEQFGKAKLDTYDLILIHGGANDVIFFGSPVEAERELDRLLVDVRKKSNCVILLTAGDVGKAPIFPWPLNDVISARTRDLRQRFMRVAEKYKVVYVDIYSYAEPFGNDPERYYVPDMLHLSGEGYGFWFGIVKEYVEKEWPELIAKNN